MAASTNLSASGSGSPIPESIAQQLINTYMTEEGWAPDKTRAIWFSPADLANIQGLINAAGGDGVRIYFGKYPSDLDIPGTPDPAYKGKVTVVFIPTLAAPNGSHQDLFPALPQAGSTDDGDQGYNHGELCPPNCTPPSPTT
ncbi:MAG TPA: hypothetical protein VNS58_02105 [Puia sp.]|nr:hypothetical protein [Puia sp.]